MSCPGVRAHLLLGVVTLPDGFLQLSRQAFKQRSLVEKGAVGWRLGRTRVRILADSCVGLCLRTLLPAQGLLLQFVHLSNRLGMLVLLLCERLLQSSDLARPMVPSLAPSTKRVHGARIRVTPHGTPDRATGEIRHNRGDRARGKRSQSRGLPAPSTWPRAAPRTPPRPARQSSGC